MGSGSAEGTTALCVRVAGSACALPIAHVVETHRPLGVKPIAGTPPFVRGVSIIRGAPTPVVDLACLLQGGEPSAEPGRLVTLRVGARRVALAVESVIGVRALAPNTLLDLPPLLKGAQPSVEAVGALDADLLLVLRASWLIPEGAWAALGLAAEST